MKTKTMQERRWNSQHHWLACLFAALSCGLSLRGEQVAIYSALPQEQQDWLSHAYRHEKHGWIYLHVEGTARERGFQHGFLLAKEIAEGLRVTKAVWEHDTSMDWAWLLKKATPFLEAKTDPENLAEIDGIVEGLTAARISSSRAEMLVYNAWIEL